MTERTWHTQHNGPFKGSFFWLPFVFVIGCGYHREHPIADKRDELVGLKLSIQRALLGEVTDRLVAVTCGIKDQLVSVRTYVKGPVQEDDVETLSFIATGVIADYPDGYVIEERCVSADDGEPQMLDFWAFKRKD